VPGRESINSAIQRVTLVSGASNMVFNGLAAWLLLGGGANLTFAGNHSFAVDVAATAFILPFIVTLIVIPLNRRKRVANKLDAVRLDPAHWLEARLLGFPNQLTLQACIFGAATLLLATPLTLLPLWLLGIHEFTPLGYSVFKGVWAGLIAAALTRPMLLLAVREN